MNIENFIIANIIISVTAVVLILFRHTIGRNIKPIYNRSVWIMFMLLLIVPFLRKPELLVFSLNNTIETGCANYISKTVFDSNGADLYVSIRKSGIIVVIWVSGIIFKLMLTAVAQIKLFRIKKVVLKSEIFENLCKELNVKPYLYSSDEVKGPFSYGLLKKYVVVPGKIFSNEKSLNKKRFDEKFSGENSSDKKFSDKKFSDKKSLDKKFFNENNLSEPYFNEINKKIRSVDCRNILLHELYHIKHGDTVLNFCMCMIACFYWFNPFVYAVHSIFRTDMELYCDYSVIRHINSPESYAETILNLAENGAKTTALPFCKNNLKLRIRGIKNLKNDNFKRGCVVLIAFAVAVASMFVTSGFACTGNRSKKIKNAVDLDLSDFFGENKGTFVLYNFENKNYYIYNQDLAYRRKSPCSTYKIAIALNSLENGTITSENSFEYWNGSKYPFDSWNCNQDLYSAMKYSVNWYFQRIDTIYANGFLNDINYGNKNTGFDRENYWLDGTLKISAVEQVDFLTGLIENKYGFSQSSIDIVMKAVNINDNLYGKTGTEMINNKVTDGWFVGYVFDGGCKYAFALRVEGENDGAKAREMAVGVLESMGEY